MSIASEIINNQMVTTEAHTGVFQSHARRIAIVVKVKDTKVFYLHLTPDCKIILEQKERSQFLVEYPVELYRYPAARAIRKYVSYVRHDHFDITEDARKVINAILSR